MNPIMGKLNKHFLTFKKINIMSLKFKFQNFDKCIDFDC